MDKPLSTFAFRERLALFAGMVTLWLVAYFGVGLLQHGGDLVLSWDPVWRVPYVSAFTLPYTSAYLMPAALLFVPCDRATFHKFVLVFAAAILVSVPCFLLVPLAPPRIVPADGLLDRLLALQYHLDVDGNCFPSLHVSLAFLTALAVGRCLPRLRAPMLAWAALVAVSTVFVHQHYCVDAVAGALLATVLWRLLFRPSASS